MPWGGMLQLRRVITYLWTLVPRGGAGNNGDGTRSQAPLSVVGGACDPEMVGSSRAVNRRESAQKGEEDSSASGVRHDEPQPPPIRVVRLSYPWGTHDSRPPAGWSTAAPEDPSRINSHNFQRGASSSPSSVSASADDGYWRSRAAKHPRDQPLESSRHCHSQCKTSSSFVSPSQSPLPEIDAEAKLQFLRSWPPPQLTFRARVIMRAVSGRETAVKRPISRSRRRELDDALVRRAYDATHPSAPQGKEDGEEQQDSRSLEDASRARQEKEEAFWRRLRRVEEEKEKEEEEMFASMVASMFKSPEIPRVEVKTELADALADVITSATAALEGAPGPDKAAEDQATKDDRGAAAAGTTAPAPTAAPTAPGMVAGHRPEAIEQETVQPVSTPTFLERAEGRKKAVKARRSWDNAMMVNPDKAKKRRRMAF